jgi:hypothetical protein
MEEMETGWAGRDGLQTMYCSDGRASNRGSFVIWWSCGLERCNGLEQMMTRRWDMRASSAEEVPRVLGLSGVFFGGGVLLRACILRMTLNGHNPRYHHVQVRSTGQEWCSRVD